MSEFVQLPFASILSSHGSSATRLGVTSGEAAVAGAGEGEGAGPGAGDGRGRAGAEGATGGGGRGSAGVYGSDFFLRFRLMPFNSSGSPVQQASRVNNDSSNTHCKYSKRL